MLRLTLTDKDREDAARVREAIAEVFDTYPRHGYASVIIGGYTRVYIRDVFGKVHLSGVETPREYAGQGHGTRALKELIGILDRHRVTASLFVSGYGEVSDAKLVSWYEKFGFVSVLGTELMYRTPKQGDRQDEP